MTQFTPSVQLAEQSAPLSLHAGAPPQASAGWQVPGAAGNRRIVLTADQAILAGALHARRCNRTPVRCRASRGSCPSSGRCRERRDLPGRSTSARRRRRLAHHRCRRILHRCSRPALRLGGADEPALHRAADEPRIAGIRIVEVTIAAMHRCKVRTRIGWRRRRCSRPSPRSRPSPGRTSRPSSDRRRSWRRCRVSHSRSAPCTCRGRPERHSCRNRSARRRRGSVCRSCRCNRRRCKQPVRRRRLHPHCSSWSSSSGRLPSCRRNGGRSGH